MDDLRSKRCLPCEGGVPRLEPDAVARLAPQVRDWTVAGDRLRRRFVFPSFAEAMRFVNGMAAIAETENHHPDFAVHYRQVDVEIWTHAVGGLTENDFVLAAKIDAL